MNESNKRSSREWKVVLSLIVTIFFAFISCGVTTTLFTLQVDSNNHDVAPIGDATPTVEHHQHRRLSAIEDEDNTISAQQTSTIPLTSKFNEKRSFLDPSWKEWGDALVQFETLVSPAELDFTISRRLPWEQDESPEKCDEILVLMPEYFARNGHGSQLNSYVLAAMMATYLGKAMLVLDAPQKNTKYPNGSMVSGILSMYYQLFMMSLLSYAFYCVHSLVAQLMPSKIKKSLNNSKVTITNILI